MAARIVRISAVALVVFGAAACGSTASKQHASTRPSTPPKLTLAKSGARSTSDAAQAPHPLAIRPPDYVLDGPLPDLGTQAPVYRWTAHAVTIDDVSRLADAFGIHGGAVSTADGFQASDADATLMVTTAGDTAEVSYFLGAAGAIGGSSSGSSGASTGASTGGVGTAPGGASTVRPVPPPASTPAPTDTPTTITLPTRLTAPVDVPGADEATSIARTLLDKAGVLAGQQWKSEVTDSGGIAISCAVGADCTTTPEQVTARDVTFNLVIDGIRVDGISWTVTVGEHSRIESINGEWATAVKLGTYDLRSTADAFTALEKGDSNFAGVERLAGGVPVKAQDAPATGTTDPSESRPIEVHVTGASLGMARWNAVDGGHNVIDLVPTYLFHTRIGDAEPSDVSELALDPAAIDFATPIPVPVPEPGTGEPAPVPAPAPAPAPKPTPAS